MQINLCPYIQIWSNVLLPTPMLSSQHPLLIFNHLRKHSPKALTTSICVQYALLGTHLHWHQSLEFQKCVHVPCCPQPLLSLISESMHVQTPDKAAPIYVANPGNAFCRISTTLSWMLMSFIVDWWCCIASHHAILLLQNNIIIGFSICTMHFKSYIGCIQCILNLTTIEAKWLAKLVFWQLQIQNKDKSHRWQCSSEYTP